MQTQLEIIQDQLKQAEEKLEISRYYVVEWEARRTERSRYVESLKYILDNIQAKENEKFEDKVDVEEELIVPIKKSVLMELTDFAYDLAKKDTDLAKYYELDQKINE